MSPSDDRHPRPARPRPARPESSQGKGAKRGGGGSSGGEGVSRPTPVRDLPGSETGAGSEGEAPPRPSSTLQIEGTTWTVRVRGWGRAGASSATPLILLGFFRSPDDEEPERELLVAARSLEGLSEVQLAEAFGRAEPPPKPGAGKELFPETRGKGRKGEGG